MSLVSSQCGWLELTFSKVAGDAGKKQGIY